MEKYRINTEYDDDKDNEIIFSNYNYNGSIEKREVEKLVREYCWNYVLRQDKKIVQNNNNMAR